MGRGFATVYVTMGEGQPTLPGTERSSSFSVETVETFGRGVPNDFGSLQPVGRLEQGERQELGLGDAVLLVVLVVLDHDVARAHQP